MNDAKPAVSKNKSLSVLIFFAVSIALAPVSVAGYILYIAMALVYQSKRTPGVSMTAQGPLSARWTQHQFGVRWDEAASLLMMALPGVPHLGWYLVISPTMLAHRLSGYTPKAFRYPYQGEVPPLS